MNKEDSIKKSQYDAPNVVRNLSPNKSVLKLDWCSYKAAKYAVEHWHYSRKMPGGKRAMIGVWEDSAFIGALIFGNGVSPDIGTQLDLNQTEIAELMRVALREHKSPVSRILSIAVKMIRKNYPRLRCLVSFADSKQGHTGGIYQATNWTYVGTSEHRRMYVDGIAREDATVRSKYGKNWRTKIRHHHQIEYIREPPKFKYILPLEPKTRNRIELLRKPYPKRATSETVDTSVHQTEERGSTPTVALQSFE